MREGIMGRKMVCRRRYQSRYRRRGLDL